MLLITLTAFFFRTRRYDERPPPPRYDERDRDRGYDDRYDDRGPPPPRYDDRGPPPPRYDDRGYDDRRGGDRYAERPPPRRYDDDGPRNPRGPSYTPGPKGPGGPGTDGPPPPPDVDGEPSNQWIFDKLVEREKARVKRDFGTADAIRDELLRLGVSAQQQPDFLCACGLSLSDGPPPLSSPCVCVVDAGRDLGVEGRAHVAVQGRPYGPAAKPRGQMLLGKQAGGQREGHLETS